MNSIELIKRLLPGLAPLILFVIADSIWGTEVGLVVAIGFGLLEIGYSLVRKRRPDRFILFGVYFVFELYKKRRQKAAYIREEWLPMVDEAAKVLGKMPRSVAHSGSMILHPVVHMHVFDSKGRLFLQKRAENKLAQPGKWDTAVGGHVAADESVELALQREAAEEIGLRDFNANPFKNYKWESSIERELVFAFVTVADKNLKINPEEASEGRFWTLQEIDKQIGKNVFTPNFEYEFGFFKK